MATHEERFTAIANALVNGVATNAQKNTLGRALVGLAHQSGDDPLWNTYTAAERAAYAMSALRGEVKKIARAHRTRTAINDAQQAIDGEFAESP